MRPDPAGWKKLSTIVGFLLALLLSVSACVPLTTSPRQEETVEIGDLTPLTGPAASAEQPCHQGRLDYVRFFNEQKGIPGVVIKIVWIDMGREMGKFISGYRVLVDRGVPLIFSNDTTSLETLKAQFEKDRTPFVAGTSTGPMLYPPGWVFPAWATQGEASTAVLDYFMKNWREQRPPKLQLFVYDGAFGRGPAEEAAKYANNIGFEVLPIEVCGGVVIDASTQLLRIRDRGADFVYIQNIVSAAGPIMRDAERLGLQHNIQFAGTEWTLGESLIKMAPVSVEGFLAPRCLPWFDELEISGVRMMREKQLEYHGQLEERPEYMGGWVYGAIMCQALRQAIKEVGYENLDGSAVKRALESMKDLDIDGMVKITFGPDDRRGSTSFAVYQVRGGKIVRVSDWHDVPILVP